MSASEGAFVGGLVTVVAFSAVGLVGLGMWGCPKYDIYQQEMSGHATFAKAESTRRVKVLESQAKLDAAKLEAQSDIERAKGIAAANEIVVKGLGGPDNYLRWKYIQMLEDHGGTVHREIIYVPTEANVPIMEAGRAVKALK